MNAVAQSIFHMHVSLQVYAKFDCSCANECYVMIFVNFVHYL